MSAFDRNGYQQRWRGEIDAALLAVLDRLAQEPGCPPLLAEAIRYAVMGEGKRLRPLLVLGALRATGADEEKGLTAACAIELIHASSLVHDDLPAMDDDDFRRGRPTCHRVYGEALAILAGDALLTQAFHVLAQGVSLQQLAEAVSLLSWAAGPSGMIGGQADDVREGSADATLAEVESIHRRKTGAMIEASVRLGGLLGNADASAMESLCQYGCAVGLAFQIVDDLLAFWGDERTLKRPTGSDEQRGRRTYPRLVGPEQSLQRVESLIAKTKACLPRFGDRADVLLDLADMVLQRSRR